MFLALLCFVLGFVLVVAAIRGSFSALRQRRSAANVTVGKAAKPRVFMTSLFSGVVGAVLIFIGSSRLDSIDPYKPKSPAHMENATATRPSGVPAKFKIFKQVTDENSIVPLVVSRDSTDDQIVSLLWLLKDHVADGTLNSIGIRTPGEFAKSGDIEIFRGARCASEDNFDKPLPCGAGNHSAAFYGWKENGKQDLAAFSHIDESLTKIFGNIDTSSLEKPNPIHGAPISDKQSLVERISHGLHDIGSDATAFQGTDPGEIVVNSDAFKADGGRIYFLASVLPKWRKQLCNVGFSSITLDSDSFTLSNHTYSVGCK